MRQSHIRLERRAYRCAAGEVTASQSSAFQSNGRDYGGFKVSYYLSGFGEISMAMLGMCGGVAE